MTPTETPEETYFRCRNIIVDKHKENCMIKNGFVAYSFTDEIELAPKISELYRIERNRMLAPTDEQIKHIYPGEIYTDDNASAVYIESDEHRAAEWAIKHFTE